MIAIMIKMLLNDHTNLSEQTIPLLKQLQINHC